MIKFFLLYFYFFLFFHFISLYNISDDNNDDVDLILSSSALLLSSNDSFFSHSFYNPSLQLITIGVDGMIWSINKNTGEKQWSLDTGSPMFSFHCSSLENEDPFLLIPSSKGDLYTYSNGYLTNIGTNIQQLVSGTPLQTEDGAYWIASKIMQMWAINNKGELVHSWKSTNPLFSDIISDDWGDDILILVRITYNLQAIDPFTGILKWNISTSEFNTHHSTFSNENSNIFDDNDYITIASDGSIYKYNENDNNYHWKHKLPSNIVTTFELEKIYNINDKSSSNIRNLKEYWRLKWPPKNPIHPPHLTMNLPSDDSRFPSIFVGIHEGSLYAIPLSSSCEKHSFHYPDNYLSVSHYPQISDGIDDDNSDHSISIIFNNECNEYSPDFPECIIGINSYIDTNNIHNNNNLPSISSGINYIPNHNNNNNNNDDDISITTDINDNRYIYLLIVNISIIFLLIIFIILYKRLNKIKETVKEDTKNNKDSKELKKQNTHPPLSIGKLYVDNIILGHGSSGTIVFKGTLDGRAIAIKRMLKEYYSLASKEIKMLQSSDEHQNVVRYYTHETDDNFIYLALSYCSMNLDQYILRQKNKRKKKKKNNNQIQTQGYIITTNMLLDIVNGLHHIHSLHIIHRDLKPHNILIDNKGIIKISDMGLAKKLDNDEHSFSTQTSSGTLGWQAPEQMISNSRQSKKIDIFALGCIIYYCLTEGEHPFGGKSQREYNIINNKYSLNLLKHNPIAQDLINKMIQSNPKERIDSSIVLRHPFFWSSEKTLDFFRITSDRFESEKPNSNIVLELEGKKRILGGKDWLNKIHPTLKNELQTSKYRKYKGNIVRDLLRVIRNKTHHYRDLPIEMQQLLGDLPNGFLHYWISRFPYLLIDSYIIISNNCKNEANFAQFF